MAIKNRVDRLWKVMLAEKPGDYIHHYICFIDDEIRINYTGSYDKNNKLKRIEELEGSRVISNKEYQDLKEQPNNSILALIRGSELKN